MAKDFAKGFYNSKRWRQARDRYVQNKHGICERCRDGKSLMIVHHKIPITQANITDDNITLNEDNFELLCQDCHNAIDHEALIKHGTEESFFTANGDYMPPIQKM